MSPRARSITREARCSSSRWLSPPTPSTAAARPSCTPPPASLPTGSSTYPRALLRFARTRDQPATAHCEPSSPATCCRHRAKGSPSSRWTSFSKASEPTRATGPGGRALPSADARSLRCMTAIGRNAPCPCGSGLKYKRCCLRHASDLVLDAAGAEQVWSRMQSWALARWDDELGSAPTEHMDARGIGSKERPAQDDDLSLALCWLLIDRKLDGAGGTPAQLYTNLPGLSPSERAMGARITASSLGLHRVTGVAPGAWIELENVLTGTMTRVTSPTVSRQAVRWHVLLCRVMNGGPMRSLWGAAAFFEPVEEEELIAELRRIANDHSLGTGTAALE